MISRLLVTLLFCLQVFWAKAQVTKIVRIIWPYDSSDVFAFYATHGSQLQWHNWLVGNRDRIPVKQDYDVYYDRSYKHLGYSYRGELTDTGWATLSVREYYLTGIMAKEQLWDQSKGNFREIFYDYQGDTSIVRVPDEHYIETSHFYSRSRWNPEKRYLASCSSYNANESFTVRFDEKGDTTYFDHFNVVTDLRSIIQFIDGRRSSIYIQDKGGDYHQQIILYNKPGEKIELGVGLHNQTILDSLQLYSNVRRIYLGLHWRDTTGTAAFLARLNSILLLPKLEEITLDGPFEKIPPAGFQCKGLLALHLKFTNITVMPEEIRSLKLLRSIKYSNNALLNYSASLRNLARLPNLRELVMPLENGHPLPAEITRLRHLKYLSLGSYGLCDSDSSPAIDIHLIYKLRELRELEICWDQFMQVNVFEFAKRLPRCEVRSYHTCFDRFSQVTLANGKQKLISDIHVGDVLLSYNTQSEKLDSTEVKAVHIHHKPMAEGIRIRYHSAGDTTQLAKTIATTAVHPFYVNAQWTMAAEIKCGDVLLVQDGESSHATVVDEVTWYSSISEEVYNFSTADHTFFVNGVLVHNK